MCVDPRPGGRVELGLGLSLGSWVAVVWITDLGHIVRRGQMAHMCEEGQVVPVSGKVAHHSECCSHWSILHDVFHSVGLVVVSI